MMTPESVTKLVQKCPNWSKLDHISLNLSKLVKNSPKIIIFLFFLAEVHRHLPIKLEYLA